jgi:hypothetical protein
MHKISTLNKKMMILLIKLNIFSNLNVLKSTNKILFDIISIGILFKDKIIILSLFFIMIF